MSIQTCSSALQETTKCWSWSIQPLVTWIRILGVDIPDVSRARVRRRHDWLFFFYGVSAFLLHAIGQIDVLYYVNSMRIQQLLQKTGTLGFGTATATWNYVIDFSNYVFYAIGGHLVLLLTIRSRWAAMMECFNQTQLTFDENFFIELRIFSKRGVTFVIFLITALWVSTVCNHIYVGSTNHPILTSFTSTVGIIYPMTAILLFSVLCFASSKSFRLMKTEVRRLIMNKNHSNDVGCRDLLLMFKHRHAVACEMVNCINYISGSTLFFSIPFCFIAIINCSFYVFGLDNHVSMTDVIFCIFAIVYLVTICFIADHIQIEANGAMKELLKLSYDQPFMWDHMELKNMLISEMATTVPLINANGYFNVGKQLIPQLIGTTFTYFFILYQFETSEIRPSS